MVDLPVVILFTLFVPVFVVYLFCVFIMFFKENHEKKIVSGR